MPVREREAASSCHDTGGPGGPMDAGSAIEGHQLRLLFPVPVMVVGPERSEFLRFEIGLGAWGNDDCWGLRL